MSNERAISLSLTEYEASVLLGTLLEGLDHADDEARPRVLRELVEGINSQLPTDWRADAEIEMNTSDGLGGGPAIVGERVRIPANADHYRFLTASEAAQLYEAAAVVVERYAEGRSIDEAINTLSLHYPGYPERPKPSNALRVAWGGTAVAHGCPDQDEPDRERAIDTVANVLHWLADQGEEDPAAILSSAAAHFLQEDQV